MPPHQSSSVFARRSRLTTSLHSSSREATPASSSFVYSADRRLQFFFQFLLPPLPLTIHCIIITLSTDSSFTYTCLGKCTCMCDSAARAHAHTRSTQYTDVNVYSVCNYIMSYRALRNYACVRAPRPRSLNKPRFVI